MEDGSSVAVLVPHPRGQQEAVFVSDPQKQPHKQAADSLIQVIEKLSKIVENQPRRCTLPGKKRPSMSCASVTVSDSREGTSPCKIPREQGEGALTRNCTLEPTVDPNNVGTRTVTYYQCSLCHFLSPVFGALKEHIKQHEEQQSELPLMCSENHFTTSQQEELETHGSFHFEQGSGSRGGLQGSTGLSGTKAETESEKTPAAAKKWYSYDQGEYHDDTATDI